MNLLQPGVVTTDTSVGFEEAAKVAPVGRAGTVDEIAAAALFLASPAASFVNAAIFTVDGGIMA